jgi:hypothetical protein
MTDNFFLGVAGHAHTMNELELDQQKELELRKKNNPEEAQRGSEAIPTFLQLYLGILEGSTTTTSLYKLLLPFCYNEKGRTVR